MKKDEFNKKMDKLRAEMIEFMRGKSNEMHALIVEQRKSEKVPGKTFAEYQASRKNSDKHPTLKDRLVEVTSCCRE